MIASTLDAFLNSNSHPATRLGNEIATAIRGVAAAALKLRALISNFGPGGTDAILPRDDGDPGGALEALARAVFLDAIECTPVAQYLLAGSTAPVVTGSDAGVAMAVHPLDGLSNVDINAALGTIFSVLPVSSPNATETFLQFGRGQLAAGFVVYGPQLVLVLTLGSGTHVFVFSPPLGVFVQAWQSCAISVEASEYAVNASNYRHWHSALRLYIDDCLSGADGPRQRDFDMRWGASLVAHIYRILLRGGVYLDPADTRIGFTRGRLGLVHQANPIALLIEQAGGRATDGVNEILDIEPEQVDEKTPLVCGSANEVARIARYHTDPSNIAERAPLFGRRGLFRT